METRLVRRLESVSRGDILADLEGHVFHITTLASLPAILAAGSVSPNRDGSLPTAFGGGEGYFRKRGCVSVFDYRQTPPDDPLPYRSRCHPFQPLDVGRGIAILVLKPTTYPSLISWEGWKKEEVWRQRVVPYVEAGFPGDLPLTEVAEVIQFEVDEDPQSFRAIVRNARNRTD